jgi:hypothetical protein
MAINYPMRVWLSRRIFRRPADPYSHYSCDLSFPNVLSKKFSGMLTMKKHIKYRFNPNGMNFDHLPVATVFEKIINKTVKCCRFNPKSGIRIEPDLLGYQDAPWAACRLNLCPLEILSSGGRRGLGEGCGPSFNVGRRWGKICCRHKTGAIRPPTPITMV